MSGPELGAAPDPRSEQLAGLTAIGRALTYATTVDQIARLAVERGAALLGADAAVLLMQDEYATLHVRAAHGVDDERVSRLIGTADDHDLGARLQALLGVGADRFIAVPLVAGGTLTGLLAVTLAQPAAPSDEWLLSALADQTAVALESARQSGEVREAMEARLRASEGATTVKDRALATLAHDIRSPLGAIEAYCELIADGIYGPVNDRQREALGRVRMSGRHLLSLLDNVMDMARLNAGVVRISGEQVELTEVAREAIVIMLPAADAKLQVLHLGESAQLYVRGDQGHLRQVLVNLIGNAVKFTPEDGVIGVTTAVERTDGVEHGVIRVTDTGPGIPASELASVLEPFYRGEGAAHAAGVGLGLAISLALVQRMDGTLTVESEVGTGSVFTIRLPLVEGLPPV